jgi:hypothetical protein
MKKPAEPSTPSGPPIREKKATDHELRKHDKFTRYGQQEPGRAGSACAVTAQCL